MSGKKGPVTKASNSISRNTLLYVSLIVAVLGYALYHLTSIGTHLNWVYNQSTIEVERYVMNDSISYQ